MARVVKVDVDGLIRGGSQIDELAADLSTQHTRSMVGLSDAESGWVGASADALAQHACAVVEAAEVFRSTENHRAAALKRVVDRPSTEGL